MPNGNIGLTQQKVAHHVVGRDLEPEIRGLFGQAVEHFWQQVGRRPLSRRDPHLTVDLLRLAGGRQRHQVSAGGHGAHMFQEIEPRGGQRNRAPRALKQGDFEVFFQRRGR